MNPKHMSLGGKEDWPRRRSPLPTSMLRGASPRRRKDANSPSPTFNSCSAASPRQDALVPVDSTDFWSSGATTPRSWSPQAGAAGMGVLDNSSGDESILFVQIRQQKRTINELSKQLEDREAELARQIELTDVLRGSADDASRHAQAEQQKASRHEAQLRWHEELLLLQGEEAKRRTAAQQSALRAAEKRHQAAIDRMLVRVAQAEDETQVLSARIKDLTQKLDRARALAEQSRSASDDASRRILDARLAAVQASQSSAELVARLSERSVYIDQLESQVRALLATALRDHVRLPTALGTPATFGLEPAAGGLSLHSEIAKATQQCSDDRDPDVPVYRIAPLQAPTQVADGLFSNEGHLRHAGKPGEHGLHVSHNSAEGMLYWLAVYVHMAWALHSRLWIRPTMDITGSMARAVFGLLALRPWLRLLFLFMPTSMSPEKGPDKAASS
ncbi:hypothetical protein GGI20_002189 [Coemansia sp. BCRC 34301]|nr:hypothetical protein GGI20_002189 [Coemansia sp. BCRC 34301]